MYNLNLDGYWPEPHKRFFYMRPDAVAECLDISDNLCSKLWDMACQDEEAGKEYTECGDNKQELALISLTGINSKGEETYNWAYWLQFTAQEQQELCDAAKVYCQQWFGGDEL